MVYIYILELQDEHYYVGKSDNPETRIKQHSTGKGSKWVEKYLPVVSGTIYKDCDPLDEDMYVKRLMRDHGINKIRGGSYIFDIHTEEQINFLTRELDGAADGCWKCSKSSHFTNQCKQKVSLKPKIQCDQEISKSTIKSSTLIPKKIIHCVRCNRNNHTVIDCYAKTNSNINCLKCNLPGHNSDKCFALVNNVGNCSRCGRSSHNDTTCYAKTHINKYPLEEIPPVESNPCCIS
jgi:predicted GIY-YIG superfamily endonuclease